MKEDTLYLAKNIGRCGFTGGYVDSMIPLGSGLLKPSGVRSARHLGDRRWGWIKEWCIELKRRT